MRIERVPVGIDITDGDFLTKNLRQALHDFWFVIVNMRQDKISQDDNR